MNHEIFVKSKNIKLIPSNENHIQILYDKAYCNPEFLRLFRQTSSSVSKDEINNTIVSNQDKNFKERHYQEFLIYHNRYGYIGMAALADVNLFHKRAELLVGLFDKSKRISSYAIETALSVMDYAYNQLQLNRLDAFIYDYNLRAQKTTESLGFTYEGLRKEYVFSTKENKFIDLCCYGLRAKEFRNSKRLASISRKFMGYDITTEPQEKINYLNKLSHISNKIIKPTLIGAAVGATLSTNIALGKTASKEDTTTGKAGGDSTTSSSTSSTSSTSSGGTGDGKTGTSTSSSSTSGGTTSGSSTSSGGTGDGKTGSSTSSSSTSGGTTSGSSTSSGGTTDGKTGTSTSSSSTSGGSTSGGKTGGATSSFTFPLCSSPTGAEIAFNPTDELIFNISFYRNRNSDIASAFGNDFAAIRQHWMDNGLAEGRVASPAFDAQYYMDTYEDIRNAFGNDFEAATRHWLTNGLREGRRGSAVFDVQYYVSANPDINTVFGTNFEQAARHWLNNGASECRVTSYDFQIMSYLMSNPDIYNAFDGNCADGISHWINSGSSEGRTASSGLNYANSATVCGSGNFVATSSSSSSGGTSSTSSSSTSGGSTSGGKTGTSSTSSSSTSGGTTTSGSSTSGGKTGTSSTSSSSTSGGSTSGGSTSGGSTSGGKTL